MTTGKFPRWILSVRDLPQKRGLGRYSVEIPDGPTKQIITDKRKRQVIDAMLEGPLFCASTVRLGDAVFRLKQDHDFHTKTERLDNGRKYYALPGKVTFLGEVVAKDKSDE
ncbi:hypothetical protein [uncultured Roseobacter sp.]|uniref:hypothetical protein n=1 Tax=uncultured Roseobacter sp. TaxID=114847 RepID=UPI00260995AD|nr:hypothetical protein [uncultured Roseobacter sp.]